MMKIIGGMIQGSAEWLAFRQCHLGATDSSVIMNLNPFKKRNQLWQEKTLGWEKAFTDKELARMAEGTRMEPIARQEFTKHTGIILEPMIGVHSIHEFLSASFDGISEDHQVVLEIKCGKKACEMALNGVIPPYYLCQIAHQLMIADGLFAFYYAFDGETGILLEVMRDREFEEKMLEEELLFWDCIQSFTQPKD